MRLDDVIRSETDGGSLVLTCSLRSSHTLGQVVGRGKEEKGVVMREWWSCMLTPLPAHAPASHPIQSSRDGIETVIFGHVLQSDWSSWRVTSTP